MDADFDNFVLKTQTIVLAALGGEIFHWHTLVLLGNDNLPTNVTHQVRTFNRLSKPFIEWRDIVLRLMNDF